MPSLDDAIRSFDDRFVRLAAEKQIPGIAWGVIRDGTLVHVGGTGNMRDGEDRTPDADTVFRIASMTKSFTAATLLLLRDEGRLRLDDPVADHVPELTGWAPPNTDAGPVTIRQLLTMTAGLPTDDPWGDRQQGLPLDAFAELLRAGPTFAWAPGTAFEYSNLGYGILGRVITNVAGAEYREVVRDRLLTPLGMTSTGYLEEDVDADRLAFGYVRVGDSLVREGTDTYGALASMGGVYSTVRDLARWVAGFLDAYPARSDPEGPHPLRRASRREMQQVHSTFPVVVRAGLPDAEPEVVASGYGMGLFAALDPDLGTFIGHPGGYPGYGSIMYWHPTTGLGAIALGNLRYAAVTPVVREALPALVRAGVAPRRAVRPAPEVERARDIAEALLLRWDDAVADASFAMNVDLDEPRPARRAAVERVAAEFGPLVRDEEHEAVAESPLHLRWWMRGTGGAVQAEVRLSPEPEPRIQTLVFTTVVDPQPPLEEAAARLLAAAVEPAAPWPEGLARTEAIDIAAVSRTLRAADARFGAMRLGRPIAGDGRTRATWELAADRGRATLAVALDAGTGAVSEIALQAVRREAPAEAW